MDPGLLRLYAGVLLYTLMMGMGLPLVPQHLRISFGASTFFIGAVAAVYGAMQVLLRLPMGRLADRIGRARSLRIAFSSSLAAGAFYVLAPGPAWMVPAQVLFGISSGIYWVAANSYLFDRADDVGVPISRATSHYSTALGLGFLVGPPLGGFIAVRWGYPAALSVFLVASALGLVATGRLPVLKPRPAPGERSGLLARAWGILRHPDIATSAFGTFTFSVVFGVYSAFYPVYVVADLGFTALALGTLFAAREVTALVMRLGSAPLLDRFGSQRVLLAGIVVAATSVALVPLQRDVPTLLIFSVLAGVGTGVLVPANLALVASGAPPAERGLANGIYGTALGLGGAVSGLVLGGLAQSRGLAWAFWGAGAWAAVGAAILVARAPKRSNADRAGPSRS